MILYKEAAALRNKIAEARQTGKTIGFVPTMGALHRGHLSLIAECKKRCSVTICSIFVNPAQFNDPEDFKKYPNNTGNDILLLENAGCDIVFFPAVAEMYPPDVPAIPHYDLGKLEDILEGKYRPLHFQGVCKAVHRLLDIVTPDYIFMGQKDYQQCKVIKRLIDLINNKAEIIIVNTVREENGLAMSSRNLRLTARQKEDAASIFKMLMYIKSNKNVLTIENMEKYAIHHLLNSGFNKVDYVAIADAETLHSVNDISKTEKQVALIAAFIGEVRLIDNIILSE